MKTRNLILTLIGLASLGVYILACSSFSPDDSKVLYPAFDADSGAIGIAVYDREAQRSEMVLVPATYETAESNLTVESSLMRAQWLDGRNILIAYAGKDEEVLNLAQASWGARAPMRLVQVPDIQDAGTLFLGPLCVAEGRLFLRVAEHDMARIDLKTLALTRLKLTEADKKTVVYPSPNGRGLFYVKPGESDGQPTVFGRMNPEDLSQTPLLTVTNELRDNVVMGFDEQGKKIVFLEAGGDVPRLVLVEQGKPTVTRTIDAKGATWKFGSGGLSSKGDMLWATFQKRSGTNTVSYGLLEVPLTGAPVRETILIQAARKTDSEMAFYFQGAVSHDGKTAAVASTYLALAGEGFNPNDCALFLVDLSSTDRKITKVPVPMPAKRPGLPGK